MIFLTVGNRYGFDRLVRAVDDLVQSDVITEPVVAQIGEGDYEPRHCAWSRYVDAEQYEANVRDARALIGHAGSGTIATAMTHRKPLLVMPRRGVHREHVNDHQVATARRFAAIGCVLVADSSDDLAGQFAALSSFVPAPRTPNVDGLVARVGVFLSAAT